ncbi:pectate lyase-like protein [Kutzneria buriramensis]|uniref:Pectate lyase-like protein n=1 Tax=Kutzneria buriramensis TaxID=1045776 RepID=A0A3E0I634_9PSEU|nr:pectate lyase-like protein [Kutzneria buriramensis]
MTRRLCVLLGLLVALVAALAVPAGAAPVWYPNGVGADLGPTPLTLGVTATAGDNAAGLRTGSVGGRSYWQTDVSAGTTYLNFAPDPDYSVSGSVVAMVTYYDSGVGTLSLNGNPVAVLAGTNTWKHAAAGLPALAAVRLTGGTADITVAQIRITAAGPSATLGAASSNTGLVPNPGDNPSGLITGTTGGRGYWQTNASSPAPATNYFYMNVADSYAYDTKDVVLVSVDYLDTGSGTLDLQYDSPGNDLPDKFKPSEIVRYGDTGTWQTHDFVLDDAVLTNRTNGSDFRIAHDGSDVEVKVAAVRVTVIPSTLDVKAGLRNLVAQAGLTVYGAREGTRDGQYPAGSKAFFSAQIAKAQAVIDDQDATPAQVKAALQALYDSYQAFKSSAVNLNVAAGRPLVTGPGSTQVDLGKPQPVNDVYVQWGQTFSHDYQVQTSLDGSTWTTVGESGATDSGSASRTDFPVVTARHVRLSYAGSADVADLQVRNKRVVTPKPQLIKTKYPTVDPVIADFVATPYGADPSGGKDSTKAIQAALYDCYDAGGGTVWLPEGTYRVTDTVEVPAFCTLRGDRRDPDHGGGSYGTVIIADLPSGDTGPVLFRIGGSAGVMGLTTYYPHQNASTPVPYSYTFEITGSAWASDENYMMGTVSDVTMLNSYRGIGISTMRDERGRPPAVGQTHESATVRNIKGTALFEGVEAYNGADVGTWENVSFSNSYWACAPRQFNPPSRSTVDSWTRSHGTGFVLGDLEWDQFNDLSASDYHVGVHVVQGQRVDFAGAFQGVQVQRTDTALLVDQFDSRWGLMIGRGTLDGAVTNNSAGFVKLTDVRVTGAVKGTVYQLPGKAPSYDAPSPTPRPSRNALYVVDAPHGNGYVPPADATDSLQHTLDRAGHDGGGTVYLPAGWYRVNGRLVVPAGVELRGASSVPNRDEDGRSGGTVLMSYSGRSTLSPDTDPALITLNGSGVRGLRVFYPGQNPAASDGLVAYPYAIRGAGAGTYVINVGMPNAYNGVDLATSRNDRFFVGKLSGTFIRHGITVGSSVGGVINGVLTNGNTFARLGFYLPDWFSGSNLFPQVIDGYTRRSSDLITVSGARDLTVVDAFGYGLHNGLVVNSGDVHVFNLGTDNLGTDGYTVRAPGGSTTVLNLLRYNGTTSTGPVRLVNVMAINMLESAVTVSSTPGGSARLAGTETSPGKYETGSSVTATARPSPGYHFVDWTIAGKEVSTSPSYTFPVVGDSALVATFAH